MRGVARLGFRAMRLPARPETIAALPPPFILVQPDGASSLVLGHHGHRLTLWEPSAEQAGETTAKLDEKCVPGAQLLIIRRAGAIGEERNWRSVFLRKVRAVMVEIVISSLAINLLALAAPLFSMTVYNKVIGQHALATLDVLALGMLVVIAFDCCLRTLRGYISAHTSARLEAYLGGEMMHHLLALPYREFETSTTGVLAERLNQLEILRAFFCRSAAAPYRRPRLRGSFPWRARLHPSRHTGGDVGGNAFARCRPFRRSSCAAPDD
jgi:ATP-binding cassette, subfamily B, bacterial HlyB/CyaB